MQTEIAHSLADPHKIALTIKEAARACSLSRSLLYVVIRQGALDARKLGGRTLILESDLQKFLRSLPRSSEIETVPGPSMRRGRPRKNSALLRKTA